MDKDNVYGEERDEWNEFFKDEGEENLDDK